jgi:chromosome segregation ATPase
MANKGSTGVDDTGQMVSCEIPGCVHRMRYSGRGRPPRYCGQVVDGLVHNRLSAYRLSKGEISLPTADASKAEDERDGGEQGYTDPEPVTSARLTLEQLLVQVRDRVAEHETHMGALAARIEAAAATASDPDAAAAEVTAAHREARTQVDAAESERDTALRAQRDAERRTEQAQAAQASAEAAAEEALDQAEQADEARTAAVAASETAEGEARQLEERLETEVARAVAAEGEWQRTQDRLQATSEELTAVRAQLELMREELATATQRTRDLTIDRDNLAAQLATEQTRLQEQRERAEKAERDASQAHGQTEQLRGQLADTVGNLERAQAAVVDTRAELAGIAVEFRTAQTAAQAEQQRSTERLAEQKTSYEERLTEQKTSYTERLDELREQLH